MLSNTKQQSKESEEKQLCKGDGTEVSQSLESNTAPDEELQKQLANIGQGDLYVIGRLWIEVLRAGLLGINWSLVPTVYAAPPPPEIPKKPPYMKYKDLPIYKAPHYEYKDYKEDQHKCAAMNRKLIHESVMPYVTSFRQSFTQIGKEVCCELNNCKNFFAYEFCKKKQSFIHYMRCPNNLAIRQATVAMGGLAGLYLTRKRGGVCSRLAGVGAGILFTGAICFPGESDVYIREIAYHTSNGILSLYNAFCNKMVGMRKRIPCPKDMPPPVAQRPPTECTKKREALKAEKAKKEAEAAAKK